MCTTDAGYVSRWDSHSSVPGVYGNGNQKRGDIFGTGQESDAPGQIRRVILDWQGTGSGRRLPQHTGNYPHSAGLTRLNLCHVLALSSFNEMRSNQIISNQIKSHAQVEYIHAKYLFKKLFTPFKRAIGRHANDSNRKWCIIDYWNSIRKIKKVASSANLLCLPTNRRMTLMPFIRDTDSCRKEGTLPKRWSMRVSDLSGHLRERSIRWVTRWWLVRLQSTQVNFMLRQKRCFFSTVQYGLLVLLSSECLGSLVSLCCPRFQVALIFLKQGIRHFKSIPHVATSDCSIC